VETDVAAARPAAGRLGLLARIWTYPIKSLRPVAHEAIAIARDGLAGDRRAALYVASPEHARTGQTYRGKEDNRLHLLVDPDAARHAAAARGVELEIRAGERYFDARPVSLILDRWVAEVERGLRRELDPLRWRPNLFARGEIEVRESQLLGLRIAVGGAILRVVKTIGRCVTTTYDQGTGESDPEVLRFVARERRNTMGVYCEVEQTGAVRLGQSLTILA
jgi:uncharacterized protein YcbX